MASFAHPTKTCSSRWRIGNNVQINSGCLPTVRRYPATNYWGRFSAGSKVSSDESYPYQRKMYLTFGGFQMWITSRSISYSCRLKVLCGCASTPLKSDISVLLPGFWAFKLRRFGLLLFWTDNLRVVAGHLPEAASRYCLGLAVYAQPRSYSWFCPRRLSMRDVSLRLSGTVQSFKAKLWRTVPLRACRRQ